MTDQTRATAAVVDFILNTRSPQIPADVVHLSKRCMTRWLPFTHSTRRNGPQPTTASGFPARLYRKDLRIVLDALGEARAPAPVTAVVQQLLTALLAQDKEHLDYSAMGTVLMRISRRLPADSVAGLSTSITTTRSSRSRPSPSTPVPSRTS